jgi:hypothetical protein
VKELEQRAAIEEKNTCHSNRDGVPAEESSEIAKMEVK